MRLKYIQLLKGSLHQHHFYHLFKKFKMLHGECSPLYLLTTG